MLNRDNRQQLLDGAIAGFTAAIDGAPRPANPHSEKSQRHLYWQWGAERSERLVQDLRGVRS